MKEILEQESILYLSIIVSIICVLLLSYISPQIKPNLMLVENVSDDLIEKNVYVEGTIQKINTLKDGSTIIKFYNTTVEAYFTKNVKANFEKNQKIRIIGTVKLYKGRLEIVVDDVRKIEVVEQDCCN